MVESGQQPVKHQGPQIPPPLTSAADFSPTHFDELQSRGLLNAWQGEMLINNQVSIFGYCMAACPHDTAAAGASTDLHIATVTCMHKQKGQLAWHTSEKRKMTKQDLYLSVPVYTDIYHLCQTIQIPDVLCNFIIIL